MSVLLGNGDGTFRPAQDFEAGRGPNAVAIGDFNGDGGQDLAVAEYGAYPQRGNTMSILLGNGDGTFRRAASLPGRAGPSYVAAGDFNRDGRTDLAVSNYNDSNVSILIGNGDGTFVRAGTVPVGAAPWFIVVDDFNGDQMPDLAVTGHWSDIVSIVLGQRRRHIPAPSVATSPAGVRRASPSPISTATAGGISPSPTTSRRRSRCCWATATGPCSAAR